MEPDKEDVKWAKKVIMICLMIIAGIYQINIGVV
jgi:hypothetical protein